MIYLPSDLIALLGAGCYHLAARDGRALCGTAEPLQQLPGIAAIDAPWLCPGCCRELAQRAQKREAA